MKPLAVVSLCALALACLGLAACGSDSDDALTFTQEDQTIEVDVGDDFDILLDGNITTGFTWTVAEPPDPDVVEIGDDRYVADDSDDDTTGTGGTFVFSFTAVGAGSTTIHFVYEQASAGVEDTAEFEIKVR